MNRKDPAARTTKVTLANKIKVLSVYETRMAAGKKGRDEILEELAKRYDKNPREIERYIKEARELPVGEVCELLKKWIDQVKDTVAPPRLLLKEIVAGGDEMYMEGEAKRLILRPELDIPLHEMKFDETRRVGCGVEREVLFRRLERYMAKSRLFQDYEKWARKAFEYMTAFAQEFSKQTYLASAVLKKFGCSQETRIDFAKTVVMEAIESGVALGYAFEQIKPESHGYVLRFGLDDEIAMGKSKEVLAECLRLHLAMREKCSEEFHPNQAWEQTEELKLRVVAELQRLLTEYERARGSSPRRSSVSRIKHVDSRSH